MTDTGQELIVTVLEAKELIGPPECNPMNTFVRIYIVPDETGAMQTKVIYLIFINIKISIIII